MSETTWQPMEEQPQLHDFGQLRCDDGTTVGAGKVLAFIPPMLVEGYLAVGVEHIERGDFGYLRAPHNPGDRVPVREEWSVSLIAVRGGVPFVHVTYSDGSERECRIDPVDVVEAVDQLDQIPPEELQPDETMPDWAARKHRICLTCTPELRDGVWGWLITWEEA